MPSTLEPRNIVVDGHRTSVRLEPDMWSALEDIVHRERTTLNRLCSLIERRRSQSSLTAAIRVYVLNYFRTAAAAPPEVALHEETARLLIEAWRPYVKRSSAVRMGDEVDEKIWWTEDVLRANRQAGLFRLFDVWDGLCTATGHAPSTGDLLAHGLDRECSSGTVNIIDVTDDNPARFMLVRSSNSSTAFYGAELTDRTIASVPFRTHAESMQLDFNTTKREGRPALHWIEQSYVGARRSYLRLVLPVSDAPDRITSLISIVRGKNTEPSIYEERIFGRRLPSLQQIAGSAASAADQARRVMPPLRPVPTRAP